MECTGSFIGGSIVSFISLTLIASMSIFNGTPVKALENMFGGCYAALVCCNNVVILT